MYRSTGGNHRVVSGIWCDSGNVRGSNRSWCGVEDKLLTPVRPYFPGGARKSDPWCGAVGSRLSYRSDVVLRGGWRSCLAPGAPAPCAGKGIGPEARMPVSRGLSCRLGTRKGWKGGWPPFCGRGRTAPFLRRVRPWPHVPPDIGGQGGYQFPRVMRVPGGSLDGAV